MYTHELVTLSELPRGVGAFAPWIAGGVSMDVASRGPMGMDRVQATTAATSGGRIRKRKAESADNERLSKRLSLLNLERNGHKLYVPVEQPLKASLSRATPHAQSSLDDSMQLDDTKHKVYIHDLDAELSDSESDDGRLVFLPDIERHLRESRIPPSILANSEGELAGNNQLVLYNVPKSLSVPEEHDSVRKAIIETRARARAKQSMGEDIAVDDVPSTGTTMSGALDSRDWYNNSMVNGGGAVPMIQEPWAIDRAMDFDPDAMDLG